MTKEWKLSVDLEDAICDRLADGESLRQICSDQSMPSRHTVLRWIRDNQSFATKCARAREDQGDWVADDIIETEGKLEQGIMDPQTARVLISSKQWRASKLAPKKYGDKLAIGGADDLPPLVTTIRIVAEDG